MTQVAGTLVKAAVESMCPGDLPVQHVVYETRAARGVVVTLKPGRYEGHEIPLRVV